MASVLFGSSRRQWDELEQENDVCCVPGLTVALGEEAPVSIFQTYRRILCCSLANDIYLLLNTKPPKSAPPTRTGLKETSKSMSHTLCSQPTNQHMGSSSCGFTELTGLSAPLLVGTSCYPCLGMKHKGDILGPKYWIFSRGRCRREELSWSKKTKVLAAQGRTFLGRVQLPLNLGCSISYRSIINYEEVVHPWW